jgi:uncharacterized membrane protein
MADLTTPTPEPSPSGTAPKPAIPEMPKAEVEDGKVMAILCYLINVIVPIVCLATKNNAFSLYHAKQALTLAICVITVMVVSIPLMCIGIGFVTYLIGGLGALVFSIIGLVNAAQGNAKPLPLIGAWGENWFKSIQKA